MSNTLYPPVHPGEILQEEFLTPLGITAYRLGKATGLSQTHIGQLIHGKRAITPGVGIRIARALGLSDMFWINAQTRYDYEIELEKISEELSAVVPLIPTAV
jgi:addiction module HigA family antidote